MLHPRWLHELSAVAFATTALMGCGASGEVGPPTSDAITEQGGLGATEHFRLAVVSDAEAYASGGRTVWRSTDGARSWHEAFTAEDATSVVVALGATPAGDPIAAIRSRTGDVTFARGRPLRVLTGDEDLRLPELGGTSISSANIDFNSVGVGWASFSVGSNANFSRGRLFRTEDGGVVWNEATIPTSGPVSMMSAAVGWASNGPDGELYETRDGGSTWKRVLVERPAGHDIDLLSFGLPRRVEGRRLILPVTYTNDEDSGVLWFASDDAGRTWDYVAQVSVLGHVVGHGVDLPVSVVSGEHWIVGRHDAVKLFRTLDGGRSWQIIAPNGLRAVRQLVFVSEDVGWALETFGDCVAAGAICDVRRVVKRSMNGGSTWE